MSKPILETNRPTAEALASMRALNLVKPSTRWAAYQNVELGHLQFLAVGPEVTFPTAPRRMPDTLTAINWRYWFCGWVNLETGAIEEGVADETPGPEAETPL